MYKKILIVLLIAFWSSTFYAQKFELGKVSIAELEEKSHPKDPSAVAAVLFDKGEVTFQFTQADGFVMNTEVTTRIKIYKKEGYEWASKAVRYYTVGGARETVDFSDAVTFNLVDGKIVKSKLKSEGEFDVKIDKYYGKAKITMPNVKEGSVIEFKYTIKSPSIGSLKEWDFQSGIPVNYSEYKTYIPEYFVYNPNQKGFIFPKVTTDKESKTVNFSYRDKNEPGGTVIHSTSQEKLEFTETRTTYLAENMPAMKDEAYVNNIDNYTSSISNELSMINMPGQPYKSFSTDWATVTKKIYEYDDFGPELNKTGYFEDDINAIIAGLTTQDEKITAIFNYVKSKVKWDKYYGYVCENGVKKAYKDKTGNVAEINLMLTAMLRYAGITANPVLISTRSNGIAFFPNRNAFNYVIAGVESANGAILLDATEKFSEPNVLPLRDLNWFGRLIRKDGTSETVDLMPKALSKAVNNLSMKISSSGVADGKLRSQLTNQKALIFRAEKSELLKENYLEQLENENKGIEISDYTRENDNDTFKPIIATYSFKDKSAEIINGKIYFAPALFLTMAENPFKQEKREYPIDFGYPAEFKTYINIEIPDGYSIESMPTAMNIATGENVGAFKYIIGSAENKIQIQMDFTLNSAIVPADFYDVLKDFYQKMVDKENEKIVLVKNKA